MAETTKTLQLDGNQVVRSLTQAGLDPTKLDLQGILGGQVDVKELESRLRAAGSASASGWHVSVTVSRD